MSPRISIISSFALIVLTLVCTSAFGIELDIQDHCAPLNKNILKRQIDRLVGDERANTTIRCRKTDIEVTVTKGVARSVRRVDLQPDDVGASRTLATIAAELIRSTQFKAQPKSKVVSEPIPKIAPKTTPFEATIGLGPRTLADWNLPIYGVEFGLSRTVFNRLFWRVAGEVHIGGSSDRTIAVDVFSATLRPEFGVFTSFERFKLSGGIGPQLGALVISPERNQIAATNQVVFFTREFTVNGAFSYNVTPNASIGMMLLGGWSFGEIQALDTIDGDIVVNGFFGDLKLQTGFRF